MPMSDSKTNPNPDNLDAERYFLGEMSAAEQEEFEARMFESRETAEEVLGLYALAANAKAVMAEGEEARAADRPAGVSWMDLVSSWLRPAVLWPAATVALLAVVSYQAMVSTPRLRRELADTMRARVVATTVLRPLTRGDGNTISLDAAQPLIRLSFDVNWSGVPEQVACRIAKADGEAIVELPVEPRDLAGAMEIAVPAGLFEPGRYVLTLSGTPGELEERFEFDVTAGR